MAESVVRHAFSPKAHETLCQRCGGRSYDAIHAPDEQEYRRRKNEERRLRAVARSSEIERVARTGARVSSGSKCKNCGYDLRGIYGSDRTAHKDGWCRD